MNIDNLKCFILVADNLSFARAAETLYISQPAVTKQINNLEQELGTPLFIRSTRHVELTPAGMQFYKDAKDIVIKSENAINRVKKQNTTSDFIHIGLSNTTALFYLSPILTKLHEAHPNISPNIEVLNYKTILNLFLEDKLDLLFYYKENMPKTSGIIYLELEKDNLSCVVPINHPLATKKLISLEDLKNESIIACNPLNAPSCIAGFQQKLLNHYSIEKTIYCDSIEISHCMVSAKMGIAILPSILCLEFPNISVIPLDSNMQLSFGIFYHTKNNNIALKKFLKLL